MSFKVMSKRCDQCLLDPENRIVSNTRAASLIPDCISQDIPFFCHKATIAGQDVACRGLHDTAPCRNARMAEWLGLPFREFDPETMKPVEARPEQAAGNSPGLTTDSTTKATL